MVSIFGLFATYRDAEQAIDTLVVEGVEEEAVNVIANAPAALERVGAELDSADMGKTAEEDGMSETLDSLLSSSPQVGVPETGMVVAGGKQARELVEHNTGIDKADTSLPDRLTSIGLSADEVGRYLGGVRNRGIMIWVRTSDEQVEKISRLLESNGARHIVRGGV
ncbi:MAG: hypothetical protein GF344_05660 [Chitinivibrionales bacterium]|nr:hypothetical protein [Chitinivibrionales bacterium]MBD3356452.1 hypothetical protein [Chitinivibrionales bacterium]